MANKKEWQRICCVCRRPQMVASLVRIVRVDGDFVVQPLGGKRLNGRGAYLCPECIPAAVAKKALNRSFRAPIPEEIYTQLKALAVPGSTK